MKILKNYIIILLFLIVSCKGTSRLPEDTFLYTGAEINISSNHAIENKGELTTELEQYLKPEPNDQIFGMRPKLWLYNLYDTVTEEKKFKYWVKYKLGSPPVFLSDVTPERIETTLRTALENHGFFDATVESEIHRKDKTATISYNATVSRPYTFGEIHLPKDDNALARAIRSEEVDIHIRKGQQYNLQELQQQRADLERTLKNKGFYYFNDNYLLYQIDTTVGDRQVEVFMTIKDKIPAKATRTQQIEEVIIHTSYETGDTTNVSSFDSLEVGEYTFVSKQQNFRPEVISRQIRVNENDLYTRDAEEITISRLLDLGVFKYVNINFEDMGRNKLRGHVRLSPMKRKSIQAELQAVTKSNSFAGPALQFSFRNRNLLKGAELYELRVNAGYEFQIGGGTGQVSTPLNSYELGIENSLTVPRLITPFNIHRYSTRYVPSTIFNLGYRLLNRVNFFTMNAFDLGYGFRWRETITKTHNLFPIDVSYIRLSNESDVFMELKRNNTYIQRSYENQFILGSRYSYVFNSLSDPDNTNHTHNFYFNGNVDISGNLMQAIQSTSGATPNPETERYEIFGSAYSQFGRADIDLRHYLRFDKNNKLASRIIFGVGVPFGNSSVLPYTKQFSIGGSSSIRAFRARSIGPGTFRRENLQEISFFDQTADIKLEANVEYRFHIVGSFKGAVFVDGGNIWTIEEDTVNRPGGQFTSSFLNQLAIGVGAGVRLDIQFFVLRLDLATPVRVPYGEGNRWFMAISERRRFEEDVNLSPIVLNIAIGYPF